MEIAYKISKVMTRPLTLCLPLCNSNPDPDPNPIQVCQGYDGPKHLLGKAEQFFLAVAGVPRYQIRTKCMLVRVSFGEKYGECEEKIQSVNRAVKQLRQSKAFKQVGG